MANEQTSVPLFASGEVLTSADMNISAGTGVPVFATTVTRDAAFGGANEKVLAEGQLCYLSSTNVVQYYDGAAWATVGPAAASGLTYITGASFSAVSSVSLPASTFTSTYKNYRLAFQVTSASAAFFLTARLRASGTDNSTSNYSYGSPGTATDNTGAPLGGSGTSFDFRGGVTTGQNSFVIDINSPQESFLTYLFGNLYSNNTTFSAGNSYNGQFNATTSFDSFSLIAALGTITGFYKVYGYSNS